MFMSRDTEAEARVTQIWPSLKGQRKKKKKGGRAIAIDVLFFFFSRDGGIACGPRSFPPKCIHVSVELSAA